MQHDPDLPPYNQLELKRIRDALGAFEAPPECPFADVDAVIENIVLAAAAARDTLPVVLSMPKMLARLQSDRRALLNDMLSVAHRMAATGAFPFGIRSSEGEAEFGAVVAQLRDFARQGASTPQAKSMRRNRSMLVIARNNFWDLIRWYWGQLGRSTANSSELREFIEACAAPIFPPGKVTYETIVEFLQTSEN